MPLYLVFGGRDPLEDFNLCDMPFVKAAPLLFKSHQNLRIDGALTPGKRAVPAQRSVQQHDIKPHRLETFKISNPRPLTVNWTKQNSAC